MRVTVFQPFRMATVARGIALVMVAGRLVRALAIAEDGWADAGDPVAVAFGGDWLMVVVTLAELAVSAARGRTESPWLGRSRLAVARRGRPASAMLALGLNFLAHHDTEYGHIPLLASAWCWAC